MTEVILCYPKTGFDLKNMTISLPLSLLSVASTLIDDFNVKIIDQRIEKNWRNKIRKELKKRPLCVGISTMTGSQISYALEIARFIKDYDNDLKIVWGGIHPTLLPLQTIQNKFVDVVVVRDGEITFKQIASAISKNKDFKQVGGIVYKEKKQIIRTNLANPTDLNSLPELPYHLLDIKNYIHDKTMVGEGSRRSLSLESSRGCLHQCTFCCVPKINRHNWRFLSAEKTVKRVDVLVSQFGLDSIIFHDENFFGDKRRAIKIARYIDNRYKWSVQARMDDVNLIDLKEFANCGLDLMQIGIESGCDRILNLIKKGICFKEIIKANKKLSNVDIEARYNFVIGFPTETKQEINLSLDLALKLLKENPNARIAGFYAYVPYPGTELFKLSVKNGFIPPKSLEEWAVFTRQHENTPWIEDYKDTLRNIILMSRFIDKKRLNSMFGFSLGKIITNLYGTYCKKRWENHDFNNKFDLILLRLLSKFMLKGV